MYSMNSGFSSDGYYNIYAGISHDKIADALTGIEEELEILENGEQRMNFECQKSRSKQVTYSDRKMWRAVCLGMEKYSFAAGSHRAGRSYQKNDNYDG